MIRVTRLHDRIGARIDDLDASVPIDPPTRAALYRAWLDHLVIVFPAQRITQDQQLALASNFGTVGTRKRRVKDRPEGAGSDDRTIMISNLRDEKGNPLGQLPDGELWFHHDLSYVESPNKATMLHAIEIPSQGGNTLFANMYHAYDKVPATLKRTLAGRKALHIYNYQAASQVNINVDFSSMPHFYQPVFAVHPETGRTALYVSRLMTARIEGLPRDESDSILAELIAISEDSSLVYEHVWTPGDTLLWDNRCCLHSRRHFPPQERRHLRRCTVEGGPVFPAAA